MAGDARLRVDFQGDASGIVGSLREIENLNKKMYRQSKEQTKATKDLDSGTRLWLREMKKGMLDLPFKAVLGGMRSMAGMARGFYRESMDAAREQQKAAKRLEGSLSAANVPIQMGLKYLDQYTRKLQSATIVGDDVAQGILGGFLPLLDGSAEKKLRQATKLTSLAVDLAALRGYNPSEVATALQNVVGKGEYGELTRLGVNKTEVDRARELDKSGGDGRQYILNSLMGKASGAAAREREIDPGAALANEIGDLKENVGDLFLEMRNAQLSKLLGPVEGINRLLNDADLAATGKNLVEAFSSGTLKDAFEPSWNLLKDIGSDLLATGKEVGTEVLRAGSIEIGDQIRRAMNESAIGKATDTVMDFGQYAITEARSAASTAWSAALSPMSFARDMLSGNTRSGSMDLDFEQTSAFEKAGNELSRLRSQATQRLRSRTTNEALDSASRSKAANDLAALRKHVASGGDPTEMLIELYMRNGETGLANQMRSAQRTLGGLDFSAAGKTAGRAFNNLGNLAPTVLKDAQGAVEANVVKKSDSSPGRDAYLQRATYQLPGVRL